MRARRNRQQVVRIGGVHIGAVRIGVARTGDARIGDAEQYQPSQVGSEQNHIAPQTEQEHRQEQGCQRGAQSEELATAVYPQSSGPVQAEQWGKTWEPCLFFSEKIMNCYPVYL